MTTVTSHAANFSSTSFKASANILSAAALVMRDPLGAPPEHFMSPEEQVVALCEFLLHGSEGEFDVRELAYLKRVGERADNLEVPCPSETQTASTNVATALQRMRQLA